MKAFLAIPVFAAALALLPTPASSYALVCIPDTDLCGESPIAEQTCGNLLVSTEDCEAAVHTKDCLDGGSWAVEGSARGGNGSVYIAAVCGNTTLVRCLFAPGDPCHEGPKDAIEGEFKCEYQEPIGTLEDVHAACIDPVMPRVFLALPRGVPYDAGVLGLRPIDAERSLWMPMANVAP